MLVGFRLFPQKLHPLNVRFQVLCTAVLIFSMGVSLGSRPDFFSSLQTMGMQSLTLAVLPILLSVAVVYPLTQRFFVSGREEAWDAAFSAQPAGTGEEGAKAHQAAPDGMSDSGSDGISEGGSVGAPKNGTKRRKERHPMIWIALASLLAGIGCGHWLFSPGTVQLFSVLSEYALYLLMFAVGISVGANRTVFRKLREYNLKILLIPAGILLGTVLGGLAAGPLLGMPVKDALSVACGLGWYSLSGVLLTDLAGPAVGSVAFLSNLMREILSFLMIPFVARHFNFYTAIAPAAATSEDTSLPMLIKYTSGDVVVIAVINGVVCSALVPVLINFIQLVF